MKIRLIFLTFFLSAVTCLGQGDLPSEETLAAFKNEDAVFLAFNSNFDIVINKAGLPEIKGKYHIKTLFLNSRARLYNDDEIYHSLTHQISGVNVFQYNLQENGKYKKTKITQMDTLKPFSQSVFYDDLKMIKFKFESLKERSITDLYYEEELTDFHFFGREKCATYFPIIDGYIEIKLDKNIDLAYQEHNFDGHNIKFSKREEKGKVILRWEMTKIRSIRPDDGMASFLSQAPVITFQISSYESNGKHTDVFSDTNTMYKWYYEKIQNALDDDNDSLRAFAQSLVSDSMSDLEKVKTIYYWIQKNVKYIAIEYGEGGVVPREPSLVYDRRYGDCKDMACLTKKMIGYAGLEADLCWIGTRSLPYKFREVPSPIVTNHMICTYDDGNKIYFLDATAKNNPIDFPSSGIQGKEALIEKGADNYRIVDVPVMPSYLSGKEDSCQLSIQGTALVGECTCIFKGFTATTLRQRLQYKKEKDYKDFFKGYLEKGNNKFELTSYKVFDLEDIDKDIRVEYKFKIDNFVQLLDDKYFVNINVFQYLRGAKYDLNTFKFDYDGNFKFNDIEKNVLVIPPDYKLSTVPDNYTLDKKGYAFDIQYKLNEAKSEVKLNRYVDIDHMEFPKERFTEWNEDVDQLNRNYKNVVVLEKK